jgi:hypothetical protein
LLARAGEDYPHDWLRSFEKRGWDTRGIHILAEALDRRYFQATLPRAGTGTTTESQMVQRSNPVVHFARLGLPFPKSLLSYQPPAPVPRPGTGTTPLEPGLTRPDDDHKTSHPASPRPNDIPPDYLNARTVHICPLDYATD